MKNKIFPVCLIAVIFLHIQGCNKDTEPESVPDIDGNEYGTVTIGTQTWMIANLKTTRYNDGTEIPNVVDNAEWGATTTGAYCWFKNDMSYKNPHGALYNWYSVNTGKLCPSAWRVASDQDWFELIDYLGGKSVAGGKLKTPGGWFEPNTGATNESGFTASPGGKRVGFITEFPDQIGHFSTIEIETSAYWWSSTEFSAIEAYYSHVMYSSIHVENHYLNKSYGFSVRCIKD